MRALVFGLLLMMTSGATAGPAFQHGTGAELVTWSRDGRRVATAVGKTIRVWTADGKPLADFVVDEEVGVLALAPDGGRVAGGHEAVTVWEVARKRKAWTLGLEGDEADRIAFSPDGELVAITSENHALDHHGPPPSVGLWLRDADTGKPERDRFGSFSDEAHGATYLADGTLAYVADQRVHLLARGRTKPRAKIAAGDLDGELAATADGRTLWAGQFGNTVIAIDVARQKPGRKLEGRLAAVTPDGKLVVMRDDAGLRFVDTRTGKDVGKVPVANVTGAVVAPDGKHVLALVAKAHPIWIDVP